MSVDLLEKIIENYGPWGVFSGFAFYWIRNQTRNIQNLIDSMNEGHKVTSRRLEALEKTAIKTSNQVSRLVERGRNGE